MFARFKQKITGSGSFGGVEFIIAGLGNPGSKYEQTRHNAGFLVLDAIADHFGVPVNRLKFKALCGTALIGGKKVLLMKPQTYMNNSGESLVEAMGFYKVPAENVLVLYDDISLEPSKLRIRRKGSHGGHNGMKSIIALAGTDAFPRIKIGVGKKPHPDYDLADWVLSRFSNNELDDVKKAAANAVEASQLIVDGKIDQAMNRFNS